MNQHDVLLTGLPRSGTTLTCELLNLVPQTVALDEPMNETPWTGRASVRSARNRFVRALRRRKYQRGGRSQSFRPERFVEEVDRFLTETRGSLYTEKIAYSKNVEGKVKGGKFADQTEASGLRKQITERSVITFEKDLSPDFVLAVKHNAGFTSALEHLVGKYRIFATVRNPLSMLSSWQTVPIPIQRGRVPRAEQIDPKLREVLDRTDDVIDRQFVLLDWFFERYNKHLKPTDVIRYEEIVETHGSVLSRISPHASSLDEPLVSRNRAQVYDRSTMQQLGRRLLATDGPWWQYYSPDSVSKLVEE